MEGPLLTKSEHNVDDVTIHGDSSSNDEHIVDITTNGDSSSAYNELPPLEDVQQSNSFANGSVWILVEFVVSLVQIVAAIVVLMTLRKDEQYPQKVFVTLIIGYTCGCIVTLPILCWRFWYYNRSVNSKTRKVMHNLKKMLEYFFVGWITVLLWLLIANSSSLDYSMQDFWLCLAFLVISCILHVAPNFLCALMCCLLPMMLRLTQVSDFIDDMDEKIMIGSLAIFACVEVLMCICTCRLSCCSLFCFIVVVTLSSLK